MNCKREEAAHLWGFPHCSFDVAVTVGTILPLQAMLQCGAGACTSASVGRHDRPCQVDRSELRGKAFQQATAAPGPTKTAASLGQATTSLQLRTLHPDGRICPPGVDSCLDLRDDIIVDGHPAVEGEYVSFKGTIQSKWIIRLDEGLGYCGKLLLKFSLNASSTDREVIMREMAQACAEMRQALDAPRALPKPGRARISRSVLGAWKLRLYHHGTRMQFGLPALWTRLGS